VRPALIGSSRDGPWLSAGPIQPGIRKRYAEGIFQVGNIAGEAHPIVAEGISMAMQSAWLLCRHLIAGRQGALAGRALDKIGQDYGVEWKSSFAARIRAASVFAHIAMRPNLVTMLLPIVEAFPQILTLGAQLSGKSKQLVAAGPENGRRASDFNKC
jgi:flavin-dependent dehydrogenase